MQVARWRTVLSYFDTCVSDRQPCSGRQIRNGFFVINLIVWMLILAALELLTKNF
jgi:hypothetical protein